MDIDIIKIEEKEDTVKYGIFFSYTSLEDAYDGVHTYEVPKDLIGVVKDLTKKARVGELSWEEMETFLNQHKVA